MASISINDLQESFELDKKALATMLGGHGGWHCKRWYEVIGWKFTANKKKKGKRIVYQKKINYRG